MMSIIDTFRKIVKSKINTSPNTSIKANAEDTAKSTATAKANYIATANAKAKPKAKIKIDSRAIERLYSAVEKETSLLTSSKEFSLFEPNTNYKSKRKRKSGNLDSIYRVDERVWW